MRCLSPIMMYDTGRLTPNGKRKLTASPPKFSLGEAPAIPVPCGKCCACRSRRMSDWIARMRLECFSCSSASFVTLTYRNSPGRLVKKDVQDFIKRLRNVNRDFGIVIPKLRYFVAGELGKRFHRPHWHGLIFGVDFLSEAFKPRLQMFKSGHPIYTSSVLEDVWSEGFVTCDRATDFNIKYVAKYIVKENPVVLKSQGIGRSLLVSVSRKNRKSTYSLRPLFLDRLSDGVISLPDRTGRLTNIGIPSAFDSYIERCDPALYESVKSSRRAFVSSLPFDNRSSADCERIINVMQSAQNHEQPRILDNET